MLESRRISERFSRSNHDSVKASPEDSLTKISVETGSTEDADVKDRSSHSHETVRQATGKARLLQARLLQIDGKEETENRLCFWFNTRLNTDANPTALRLNSSLNGLWKRSNEVSNVALRAMIVSGESLCHWSYSGWDYVGGVSPEGDLWQRNKNSNLERHLLLRFEAHCSPMDDARGPCGTRPLDCFIAYSVTRAIHQP